jgi:hypothetical protein
LTQIKELRSLHQRESLLYALEQALGKQLFSLAALLGELCLTLPTSIALSQLPLPAKPQPRCVRDCHSSILMDDPQLAHFMQ